MPLGANLNLGIAIVSYNGALDFGLAGDFAVMHDLEDLADDLLAALRELTAASAKPSKAPSTRRGAGHGGRPRKPKKLTPVTEGT